MEGKKAGRGMVAEIAKAMAVKAASRDVEPKKEKRQDVTPERGKHNKFISAGMARKVVPVIDTLYAAQKLTFEEYSGLSYYRDQALKAEDDCAQECSIGPSKVMGGGHSTPVGGFIPASLVWTPAIAETARIERELASHGLLGIARAVAVEDKSLTQWCIDKHGGRERYNGKGKLVAIVPINEKRHAELARLELKYAAKCFAR